MAERDIKKKKRACRADSPRRSATQAGAQRRRGGILIGAWVPAEWTTALDEMIARENTGRSQLLRKALEEKMTNDEFFNHR